MENLPPIDEQILVIKDALQQSKKAIVMIGLMGAGKSKLGKALAEAFDIQFIDSDDVIERNHGKITDIFALKDGEARFRRIERNVIETIISGDPRVMSTGGGAYMNEQTRALINEKGIAVWLNADVDTLYERVKDATHRPLLEGVDKREKLQELADLRYPKYAEAKVHVEVSDDVLDKAESVAQNRDRVINRLYMHLKP